MDEGGRIPKGPRNHLMSGSLNLNAAGGGWKRAGASGSGECQRWILTLLREMMQMVRINFATFTEHYLTHSLSHTHIHTHCGITHGGDSVAAPE